MTQNQKVIIGLAAAGLILAAVLQTWLGPGTFLTGWLGAAILLVLGGLALGFIWRGAGGGRKLAWIMLAAFALRLVFGAAMSQSLPVIGDDNKAEKAGYLAMDAMVRDNQAWQLAASGDPLTAAFDTEKFFSDQYGGLLALSATVYRVLSPDAHRSYLILILAALAAALAIPFFYAGVRRRWGELPAAIGAWILALYPEAVFWGSSQMREPFLIACIAVSFWGALAVRGSPKHAAAGIAAGLVGMFILSSSDAAVAFGVLAVWLWLEFIPTQKSRTWRVVGWASLVLGAIIMIAFTWFMLHETIEYELQKTQQSSGWAQLFIGKMSKDFGISDDVIRIAGETLYGVSRPLLPAAMLEGAIPVWTVTYTLRALGWYLLVPVLLYSLFALWRIPDLKERQQMVWIALVVLLWTLIASARGGGDAIDNPRYREIFLVWTALLAGWAWGWARAHSFRWLARWGAVVGIFLVFFFQLYLARYTHIMKQIDLYLMLGLIAGLSALVLGGGWLADRARRPAERAKQP
jgi:hypothetical protein